MSDVLLRGTDMRIRGLRALAPLVKTCSLKVPRVCEVYLDSTYSIYPAG